jgi:hypothetical protein
MNDDDMFWVNLPRVSYHWLRKKLNDDAVFTEQAALVLKRLRHGNHNHVYGSPEALLNHWAVERELIIYERGTPIDVAGVTLYADENGQFDAAEDAVEQGWRVDRAELVALIDQHSMTVPDFLLATAASQPDPASNTVSLPKEALGVSRNVIMGAFQVHPDRDKSFRYWDNALAQPPVWLIGARVSIGKPGVSSRWNPLLVAHGLLGEKKMELAQLDNVMRTRFRQQWDEWLEQTADDR